MQNPNVPRHDNILVKLNIGVSSDVSRHISIPARWKSRNSSKFYVPDYRHLSIMLSETMSGFAYYIYNVVLNCIQKSSGYNCIQILCNSSRMGYWFLIV